MESQYRYIHRRGKAAKTSPASRHLCVKMCGSDTEAMRQLLSSYGAVERLEQPQSEIVWCTYDTVESAIRARNGVDGLAAPSGSKTGKKMEVCFGDREDDLAPTPSNGTAPQGVTTSSQGAPEGLIVCPDFVTPQEEAALLELIDSLPWESAIKRRVQHYGFEFDYTTRSVNPSFGAVKPIPSLISALFARMQQAGIPSCPDQITINEYVPGIGIKWHIDTHAAFADGICSLSLGSPISFEMRKDGGDAKWSMGLLPRTLLIMTGQSRYCWEHGIAARQTDIINGVPAPRGRRVSITFRKVNSAGSQCRCSYPKYCESQRGLAMLPMDSLEQKGVVEFYQRIADHFVRTRHTPWPKVVDFASSAEHGHTVLDVGCGNGRHMVPSVKKGAAVFGCDLIEKFVSVCHDLKLEVLCCDALLLPYRSHVFDRVMCIAVLHHLASRERRLRALQELTRVTALKGTVLVTVWAFEQEEGSKRKFESQDVMVPWVLPAEFDPQHDGANDNNNNDNKPTSSKVDRYCHVFVKGELEELIVQMGNVTILESYYDASNWACVFKKISL
jgi:alkylated DNA repair protein alkB homolog 8